MSHGSAQIVIPEGAALRSFPFTFDSEGILNPGLPVYTPAVGDILLDGWIEVTTPWDGTTPMGDFGSFLGGPTGILKNLNGPVDLTIQDAETIDDTLISQGDGVGQSSDAVQQGIYKNDQRFLPAKWISTEPICVVVSQDGTAGGADPGSTQGAGVLYLVTATPDNGAIAGGAAITVNSGRVIDSGLLSLAITAQPTVPPSGIIQPLPPLFGFKFSGENIHHALEGANSQWVCADRAGNLWVTDANNGVWRVTTDGQVEQFGLDVIVFGGQYICSGPDGNIWTTSQGETGQGTIHRITLDGGTIDSFILPTHSQPYGICSGSDGNVWIGDQSFHCLYRVATDGDFTVIDMGSPHPSFGGICAGPDGNIWGADELGHRIFRVTPDGDFTTFENDDSLFYDICCGPDGNLWATDRHFSSVWKITPDGTLTEVATGLGTVSGITAGAGGDLWVACLGGTLLKITPEGAVTGFDSGGGALLGLCTGPDGSLWIADENGGVVAFPFAVQMGALDIIVGPLTVKGQPPATGPNSIVSGSDGQALGDSGLAYSADQTVVASTNANELGIGATQRSFIVGSAQSDGGGTFFFSTCVGANVLQLVDKDGNPTWNRTIHIHAVVVARQINTPGTDSVWQAEGVLRGDGTSAYSWVGGDAPPFTVIAQDAGASDWTVGFQIDGSFLEIPVEAADGTTVNWEVTLTLDEVAG